MTRRPRLSGYHRSVIGGGNALRAVSRVRRAAASRRIGKAPGKEPGPARWRIHERRQAWQELAQLISEHQDKMDDLRRQEAA